MDNSRIYIFDTSSEYITYNEDLLRQIAILRWGYDESKLDSWANSLKRDLFGFISFYVFGTADTIKLNGNKVIGFAYFCQDENDEKHWYYGDLIVDSKYRRSGIATRMIEMGILNLKGGNRKASKLFTYIDKDNTSSIVLHEKLSFSPAEKQESINGFDKDNRIVYECML